VLLPEVVLDGLLVPAVLVLPEVSVDAPAVLAVLLPGMLVVPLAAVVELVSLPVPAVVPAVVVALVSVLLLGIDEAVLLVVSLEVDALVSALLLRLAQPTLAAVAAATATRARRRVSLLMENSFGVEVRCHAAGRVRAHATTPPFAASQLSNAHAPARCFRRAGYVLRGGP
jgi:hypothetical protein